MLDRFKIEPKKEYRITTWRIAKGVCFGQLMCAFISFMFLDISHFLMTGH